MSSVAIVHNAAPGRGGQGMHLAGVLEALEELAPTVYCQAETVGGVAVPPSRLATALGKVPLLRRLQDWPTLLAETAFDRRIARRLLETDLLMAVAGQCTRTLELGSRRGTATLLDSLNPHIEHYAQNDELECRAFGMRRSVHPVLRRRFEREYEAADLIRVESRFARETFLERGLAPEKVVALPPALDTTAFGPSNLGDGVFRVCFVGLFYPWKGFHYLVDAYQRLALRDSELVLWGGIGARPVAQYLAARMRETPTIRLAGGDLARVGYEQAYGNASVLVHPSLADGWAYVVSEAMASGVPVIVSEWTGAAELVVDGENGYVVPPRDPDAIAVRLEHLANNPELLPKMGTAARRTAQRLTTERFGHGLREIIHGLVGDST